MSSRDTWLGKLPGVSLGERTRSRALGSRLGRKPNSRSGVRFGSGHLANEDLWGADRVEGLMCIVASSSSLNMMTTADARMTTRTTACNEDQCKTFAEATTYSKQGRIL
jgi:hypothetical protein